MPETVSADKGPGKRAWHDKFLVEERYLKPAARRRLYVCAAVLVVVGLILFTIILSSVLQHTGLERIDKSVEHWFDAQRSAPGTVITIALAIAFGPIALPIIVLVVVVVWAIAAKHLWRPLLLAGAMLVGLITVQILAAVVRRPRPPIDLMLFGADKTFGFPSGHVMAASDFLLITVFLIVSRKEKPRWAVIGFAIAIVGIAAQIISRIYLGYHWFTDTMASVSLSMVLLGLVIGLDTWRTVRIPGEKVVGELSKPQTDGT